MSVVERVALQDGEASWMAAGPGDVDYVDIIQEDLTIPSDLGTSRTQMVALELPVLRSLLQACRMGLDWHEGDTRAHYMGDDVMVVDQLDEDAPAAGRLAATIHQRVVVTGADLEASLALAA